MKIEISALKKMFSRDSKKASIIKDIETTKDEPTKRFVQMVYKELDKLNKQLIMLTTTLKKSNDRIADLERQISKYNPDNSPAFIKGDLQFTEGQLNELRKNNITISQYMKNLQHVIKDDVFSIFKSK